MTSIADQTDDTMQSEPFLGASDGHLLADVELVRVAVAVMLGNLVRLWLIAHEISKLDYGGRGWIILDDLRPGYERWTGIRMGERHFRRLLKRGEGSLWIRHGDRLYLAGIAAVAADLCIRAGLRNLKHVIATNRPGGLKSAWLDMRGSHEQFEANAYAAWLGCKAHTTIARATLENLWNRDQTTIRRWEQTRLKGRVIVTPGYAITGDVDNLPSDGASWNTRARQFVWQLPNTYRSVVRQTPRNGQRRKVKAAVDGPDLGAGADTHKRYFDTRKRLIQAIRRHPDGPARYWFVNRWRGNNFFGVVADSNA